MVNPKYVVFGKGYAQPSSDEKEKTASNFGSKKSVDHGNTLRERIFSERIKIPKSSVPKMRGKSKVPAPFKRKESTEISPRDSLLNQSSIKNQDTERTVREMLNIKVRKPLSPRKKKQEVDPDITLQSIVQKHSYRGLDGGRGRLLPMIQTVPDAKVFFDPMAAASKRGNSRLT